MGWGLDTASVSRTADEIGRLLKKPEIRTRGKELVGNLKDMRHSLKKHLKKCGKEKWYDQIWG